MGPVIKNCNPTGNTSPIYSKIWTS